jgi:hypothetical protein
MITLRHLIIAATCGVFPAIVLAVDLPTSARLYGTLKRENYVAPDGIYTVPVPVLPELGGEITDTENVVTFDDSVSTHISLASFPLDMSQRWDLTEKGPRDYLSNFYVNYVLSDFQKRYPGSSAESTLFAPELMEGSVLGFALLPGGSAFAGQLDLPGAARTEPVPTAKRGNLLFVRGERIYVLSIELAERITQKKFFNKTPEEENAILRERLIQFVNRIRFPAPKPAKKN